MIRNAFALASLAIGGVLAGCDPPPPPPYYYGPNPHVAWCLSHHPGYNPRSNLFPDSWGGLHVCRGPRFGPPPPPPPPY